MMISRNPTILVTGGAGYIGSHTILALQDQGYQIIVLDNLVYGHRELVESFPQVKLIVGDINDGELLNSIFSIHNIAAVIHFAAYAYVGESIGDPRKYYRNNVVGSLTLLETMVEHGINKIVFSSTCATYGIPSIVPITEDQPQNPINPYGKSKLTVEKILSKAYGLKSVIFRYFNVAGADPQGRLGEDHTPETHLIPLILYTALGKCSQITIYGTDYSTPDGTCIRDYIHVSDLAQAHVLGLSYLLQGGNTNVFNLDDGNGFSVREMIETTQLVTNRPVPILNGDRRPGAPPFGSK
jgi:UDP-glucose 4-epimerase